MRLIDTKLFRRSVRLAVCAAVPALAARYALTGVWPGAVVFTALCATGVAAAHRRRQRVLCADASPSTIAHYYPYEL